MKLDIDMIHDIDFLQLPSKTQVPSTALSTVREQKALRHARFTRKRSPTKKSKVQRHLVMSPMTKRSARMDTPLTGQYTRYTQTEAYGRHSPPVPTENLADIMHPTRRTRSRHWLLG